MRITKLIVRNIAPIFAAMGRHELEIDFSKQKNRIILLIGTNGSGKTTILSLLDPEPFPGSYDPRGGGREFILKDHDGYKEIHYDHNDHHYVIKHYYRYATNKGLKSFISKDGVELNPNGNSSSFKELLELELSIESDMFRLLRLGANVAGFIDMKTSERKSFMSDLLKDINVYLKFHKKVNDDSRVLKSLIKTVADKMNKLKIYDEETELKTISALENTLEFSKKEREALVTEIGRLNGFIDSSIPEGYDNFIVEMKTLEYDQSDISKSIKDIKNKMNSSVIVIEGSIKNSIVNIERTISNNNNVILVNKSKIDFFFTQLNSLYKQKEEKTDSLRYVSSELQFDKLNSHLLQLNRDRTKMTDKFNDFVPSCSKEDMLKILSLLQEMNALAYTIYDYSNSSISEAVDIISSRSSIDSFIREEVSKIDRKLSSLNMDINRINQSHVRNDKVYVLYNVEEHECAYREFYEDHKPKEDPEKYVATTREEIQSLENKRERILTYQEIGRKIEYLLMMIKSNKDIISKSPEDFFNIGNLLTNIKNRSMIYDENVITNYISILEDYENFSVIDEKIKEVKKEINFIQKNSSSLTSLQDEIREIDQTIYSTEEELENLRKTNNDLEKDIKSLEQILEQYKKYDENSEMLLSLSDKLDSNNNLLVNRRDIKTKIESHINKIRDIQYQITNIDKIIKNTEEEIFDINFRMRELRSLNEEKTLLDEKFEEIDIIREALSTNKGVPLLFINLFLKNSRSHVNQLLNTVYEDLEIDDFVIDDKNFEIPYVKKGIRVSDAIKCSQGERTFISLAISFALINLTPSLRVHNIMRLDEIDATLHVSYREKFLSIIDSQLDLINAEQVFVISHNNMYDNQQVDIIMTSDEHIENTRNVNILFKAV